MENYLILQDYDMYLPEDHETWSILSGRQSNLHNQYVSREYLNGLEKLKLDKNRIIKIDEISDMLESISGWTLVPVTGLIPTRDFFYMLINKKYPITVPIRKPSEMDFSEQPDIFHDVYGHLPLLTNEKFIKFLTAYSIIALKYVNNDRAIDFLGRLYWFTYEMGLINENGEYKPYGGAIITSAGEMANIRKEEIPKYQFDLERIFKTPYDNFKLQKEYFVIDSFDDLFNSIERLETTLIEQLLIPYEDYTLRNYTLNPNLGKKFNNVILFLNDIQYRFPQAISFAAGQPDEHFFEVENTLSKFDVYVDHLVKQTGNNRQDVISKIGQYNKTKGIINDLVAEYLSTDENIHVKEEQILITVGAQEAFSVIVSTVCDRSKDIILAEDPGYIGISSYASAFGYNIAGVQTDEEGINLSALKKKIMEMNNAGKRVKLLYVIPDYQNPSGSCMPIGNRLKLLELAQKYNFLIIEDSVYNSFTYAQKKNPTLKSLDRYNRVIYVGSFAKSLLPGLRIGVIVSDQVVENEEGENVALIDEMTKIKAQLTINTPTINQAILGGILLDNQFSLSKMNQSKFESYRKKRDHMVSALNTHIKPFENEWAQGISWNIPDGGFFIKLSVPFIIDDNSVTECAEKFGVIFCPMHYFYQHGGGYKELRLSFSNLSLHDIDTGILQLAAYFRFRGLTREVMELDTIGSNVNY